MNEERRDLKPRTKEFALCVIRAFSLQPSAFSLSP
jgi:hypothetical protein